MACCCRRRGGSQKVVADPGTSGTAVVPTTSGDEVKREGSKEGIGGFKSQKSAQGKPFPKRPMTSKLSQNCWDRLEELFRKMDPDGSNAVSKDEARAFFKGAFGKMSADAMFNEVDADGSGAIDSEEFMKFWICVRKSGYKEQDILDEVSELLEGGAWVDWKDGKDTDPTKVASFPKRPLLCRLNQPTWDKCRELYVKLAGNETESITHDKAIKHFQGAFAKVSTEAMFNEIDVNHHGQISTKEWMKFWVQVKGSGYKTQDIMDELGNLLEGMQWVDWKDGRSTA